MPIEAFFLLGILALVGALAYGILRSRARNRANDPIREAATNQLYDDPAGYEQGGKAKLDSHLKPESK